MASLFRKPGTDHIEEVPDAQHVACLSLGWIYLGPVPVKYEEVEPVKAHKKVKGKV